MKTSIVDSLPYGILLLVALTSGQRVAPGVNPQHYQHVPGQQQQQYQQQQPQYQQQQYQQQAPVHVAPGVAPQQYQQGQVQYQQQQVPVQQQYQQPQANMQVPQQQQPAQQQQQAPQVQPQHHGHHQPHGVPQQVLNTGNMDHERAHIQEHMQVPIDTSKMTEAELQFHYFKMHDSDNNNKLDGCELIKSLIHWHVDEHKNPRASEDENSEGTGAKAGQIYTDQGLADVIDYVLKTMDLDKDGYVDYIEYRKGEDEAAKDTES